MYDLIAVVIHCGSGPNRGHYISIVKSHGFWLLFDDDIVDVSILSSEWIKTPVQISHNIATNLPHMCGIQQSLHFP